MIAITRHDLDRFCPRPKSGPRQAIWDQYAEALEHAGDLFEHFHVTDDLELCHALAQWGTETGGFTLLWESGNYSVQGILNTFGKGKHSAAVSRHEAEELASIPTTNDARAKALFERVYGLGNPKKAAELGNTEPGDGYAFRGFGIQQLTGRHDHEAWLGGEYSAASSIRAALAEWKNKGCSVNAEADDCLAVTRKINGGTNGLGQRKALLVQAKEIWLPSHDDDMGKPDTANAFVAEPEADPKPWHQSKSIWAQAIGIPSTIGLYVSQLKSSFDQVQQTASDANAMGLMTVARVHWDTPVLILGIVAIAALAFIMRERVLKLARGI